MMSGSLLAAFVLFAFVSSITPGPNNIMLLASGVNYGWRPTLPHIFGIKVGFIIMVVLVGLGFGQVFERSPMVYVVLKWLGTAYLLWLAWKLFNAGGSVGPITGEGKPMSFLQAAAFQWVNPKAWTMSVAAIATYTVPDAFTTSVFMVALIYGLVGLPSSVFWTVSGVGLKRFLGNERLVRGFNVAMALLLIVSLIPTFVSAFH
ncbi:LysE family translocator [Candidatus Raskinella chloraquaticus]|jgi:threonine/homoserine/homoserine lactone efflux protein